MGMGTVVGQFERECPRRVIGRRGEAMVAVQPVRERANHEVDVVPVENVLVAGNERYARVLGHQVSDFLFTRLSHNDDAGGVPRVDNVDAAAADSSVAEYGRARRHLSVLC